MMVLCLVYSEETDISKDERRREKISI